MGIYLVLLKVNMYSNSLRNDLAFLGMVWEWEERPCIRSFFKIIGAKIFHELQVIKPSRNIPTLSLGTFINKFIENWMKHRTKQKLDHKSVAGLSLNMGLQTRNECLAFVQGFRSKRKVFAICWAPASVK